MSTKDLQIKLPIGVFQQLMKELHRDRTNHIWEQEKYEQIARDCNPEYKKMLDKLEADQAAAAEDMMKGAKAFFEKHQGQQVWYRSKSHRVKVRVLDIQGGLIVCAIVDKKPEPHVSPGAPSENIWLGWKKNPALSLEWLEPMD